MEEIEQLCIIPCSCTPKGSYQNENEMVNVESSTFGSILDETLSFKTKGIDFSREKESIPNEGKSCKNQNVNYWL